MRIRRLRPQSGGFVVLLAAIGALAPLGIDTSLPALPAMARALHTSDSLIQATLGTFMLAFALGQLVVGPLADAYGRRPVIICGTIVFTVAGAMCALAGDARVLVAARFLQGLGACAGAVGSRAIIRDVFVERTAAARMQGYASAISGLVPMLAPLLGASLLPLGWRAIYAALVAGGAACLVATAAWLPETLACSETPGGLSRARASYGRFLRLPRSLALCLLVACSFAGLFAFISGSPFVLVRELGLSNVAYGVAFAISSGAILCGALLAGTLAHRFGSERMLALASGAAALSGIVAFAVNVGSAHAPSAPVFIVAMASYAFTFGVIVPNAFAAGMERAGPMAGVAAGVMGATQMLGGAIGSTLTAALPFAAHVDVGWSAGIAGIGTIAAYAWSIRARTPAAQPAYGRG